MKEILLFILGISASFICKAAEGVFPVKRLGNTIYSGVFTGNGLLGSMTYLKSDQSIRVDIGRTDVYDHRVNNESALFDKARLPIGHFELGLPDTIQQATGTIAYHEAQAIANVTLAHTTFQVKTLTFAHRNLIYLEITSGNDVYPTVTWVPEKARSPRMDFSHTKKPDDYPENPEGEELNERDITIYKQPLLAGGGYATAWKSFRVANKLVYVISVGYAMDSDDYVDEAIKAVKSFSIARVDKDFAQHAKFWKNYYSKSNLTMPDTQLQQFYDMQLYKLASASGQNKPAIDLQGPWTASTPWPAYWHNLNTQLTYSPTFTANHLEISSALIDMLDRNEKNLINNVPEPYRHNSAAIGRSSAPDMISPVFLEIGKEDRSWDDGRKELGNLTWIMYSYYQYYRYSMDKEVYNKLFPLLKRSVNYYINLLEKDADGKYHIAVRTHSPEYPGSYHFDTNYDLSILNWGLRTLIALDEERGGNDELNKQWKDILANLRDYPQNENGFMIAKDLPYGQSHRHYSHLMMIYPFYMINWDKEENRDLITRSIAHWQSKKGALQGYSFSGAASMYAMMGKGDNALQSLQTLLRSYVKPNTLYAETGPVIETPLAAMSSIQELCLQYWDGVVRVFPAIPTSWQDVSFTDFLTDGAFLLSGTYQNGSTNNITVKSQHSGKITIKSDIVNPLVNMEGTGRVISKAGNLLELYLEKGAVATLTSN